MIEPAYIEYANTYQQMTSNRAFEPEGVSHAGSVSPLK